MDRKQKNMLSIAIMLALVAVAVWQFWPLDRQIRQGLDIKGGVSVILTAKGRPGQPLTADNMERAEAILQTRVNGLGVSEASVQRQGNDSILVQLPGIQDSGAALQAIGSTGRLEFVDVESLPASAAAAIRDWQGGPPNPRLKKDTYKPLFTGEVVRNANPGVEPQTNQPVVNVEFDQNGTRIWADYTTKNVGKQIAIVLDGVVQSAPSIREPIPDGSTQISGSFSAAEVKRLAAILEAGALPVDLTFSESRVVGPTLGQDALRAGVLAALLGLGLVAVYMAVVYRILGVTTWIALAAFAALFLGVLAIMSDFGVFALTLPGVAGIVLTIGLAADSSILMVERFKEEVDAGKTVRSASLSATSHAFGTSVDADLVTGVSALVLYAVAIGPVRGFALTLLIGIALDLTVAWFLKRPLVILLADGVMSKNPRLFGLKGGGANA